MKQSTNFMKKGILLLRYAMRSGFPEAATVVKSAAARKKDKVKKAIFRLPQDVGLAKPA